MLLLVLLLSYKFKFSLFLMNALMSSEFLTCHTSYSVLQFWFLFLVLRDTPRLSRFLNTQNLPCKIIFLSSFTQYLQTSFSLCHCQLFSYSFSHQCYFSSFLEELYVHIQFSAQYYHSFGVTRFQSCITLYTNTLSTWQYQIVDILLTHLISVK